MAEREERVYLVRMWREPGASFAAHDWRGSVHDVVTGRRLYVSSPGEVAEFISVALALAPRKIAGRLTDAVLGMQTTA